MKKNMLVAGAGKGIGLKTARLLAETCNVLTISRNLTPELDRLATRFYELDLVTDNLDPLDDLPEAIHGMVYCPGSINLKPFQRLERSDFFEDFEQNVWGAVALIQKILPRLKAANGASLVLFSTVASRLGMPFHASIAASKSAVEGLAKSLAAELVSSQVRVNVIAPSLVNTSLAEGLLNSDSKKESAANRHPLKRIGEPADIASLAVYLLSEESGWMTGQIIGVDGGLGSLKV